MCDLVRAGVVIEHAQFGLRVFAEVRFRVHQHAPTHDGILADSRDAWGNRRVALAHIKRVAEPAPLRVNWRLLQAPSDNATVALWNLDILERPIRFPKNMMAEYRVFSKLIENYGVPRIVVRNTPCCHFTRKNSGSCFVAEAPPIGLNPLSARVLYCRIPLGLEPFLQIRSYVEVDPRAIESARPALLEMRVVELIRGGRVRGPRGGMKQVVRIAVRDEVSPLSAGEFGEALEQRRLLAVDAERSMGDSFVSFEIVTSAVRAGTAAICFLFDSPCRLTDAEVSFNPAEGSWDGARAVIDDFRQHFTRPLVR